MTGEIKERRFTYSDGVTLKEYIEARLTAMERASDLAREALNVRLESMNEFRNAMQDQAGEFVTCKEMDLQIEKLHIQIDELMKFRHIAEGKASQSAVNIAYLISVIGIIIGIVNLIK